MSGDLFVTNNIIIYMQCLLVSEKGSQNRKHNFHRSQIYKWQDILHSSSAANQL